MTAQTICIYHGNCQDGFGAAWAVKRAMNWDAGGGIEFHAGVYQKAPPPTEGRDVILVDFSYKRPVLMEIAAGARSVLVIDHHKSARDDLADFATTEQMSHIDFVVWSARARESGLLPIKAIFDMDRSGAGMTWDFFHANLVRPRMINIIEDRDLWRFSIPGSKNVSEFIFSWPYDFDVWDALAHRLENNHGFRTAVTEGEAISRKKLRDIENLLPVVRRRMKIAGHDVPVANLPIVFTSDAGHMMADGEKFAACYWDTADGRIFSLRSRWPQPGATDVSEIAKQFGGGGHAAASGFQVGWGDMMDAGLWP